MGLRRQLLLVAVIALALPWAGCQYVKEMELALRHGQVTALQATAQAVASRIAADALLMASIVESSSLLSVADPGLAYYAHPIRGAISLDGYTDDWRHLGYYAPTVTDSILTDNAAMRVFVGQKNQFLHLLLHIKDDNRRFYSPAEGVEVSDHVIVRVGGDARPMTFRVFSAASGFAIVERLSVDGHWLREHRVTAVWNEKESFFLIELKMPLSWVEGGLRVVAKSMEQLEGAGPEGAIDSDLKPVIIPTKAYEDTLHVFSRPGVRLSLTLPGGWSLGASGTVYDSVAPKGMYVWAYWLVRKIIGRASYPVRSSTVLGGKLDGLMLARAQEGKVGQQWYLDRGKVVSRVVVPIILPSGAAVVVVAEESTDSMEALTTGAIGRLLLYSFLATMVVATALLAYASVLSVRVRRLSRDVQQAVDPSGRIAGVFLPSSSPDEIGELSRSYAVLFKRLQSYNGYLESLSGKLSHELRTPLAIVSSSLDNLVFHEVSSEAKVYIERAGDGAKRLSSILTAMGAASRVEQSIQGSELESVDVVGLFEQVVAAYSDLYGPCGIRLRVSNCESLRAMVSPDLLVQMLDKLVENAVDFTGPEGLVGVELASTSEGMLIRVTNTGPLLPTQLQGHIFESLISVRGQDGGTSKGGHHLGLGLYIVRLIVQFHRGEVRAYNHEDGGGVVFEITLPAS